MAELKTIEFSKFAPLLVTLAFILILIQYSFHPLESIFFDFWVKNDVSSKSFKNPIVLIAMDEESDQFLGETYPYTYASHNRLMNRLVEDSPAVVNYFVSLLEPDSEVEARYQTEFHESIKSYSPAGDKFKFGTEIDNFGEQIPPEGLRDIGYHLGQLYKDQLIFSKDEVVRRAILNISGEDSLHLWTAKKYREKIGLVPIDATAYKGAYYNSEADANFEGRITDYSIRPVAIQGNDRAGLNRVTVTVSVKYTNILSPELNFEQSFQAFQEFSLNQGPLQSQEPKLIVLINRQLTELIFNKAFANW